MPLKHWVLLTLDIVLRLSSLKVKIKLTFFFPSPILYLLDKSVKKIALMAMAITAALSLFLRRAVLWLNKRLTEAQVHTVAPQTSLPVSLATLGDLHKVTASSRRKLGRQESCLHFSIVLLPHLTINKTHRDQDHRRVETEYKRIPGSLTKKGEKPWFSSTEV